MHLKNMKTHRENVGIRFNFKRNDETARQDLRSSDSIYFLKQKMKNMLMPVQRAEAFVST